MHVTLKIKEKTHWVIGLVWWLGQNAVNKWPSCLLTVGLTCLFDKLSNRVDTNGGVCCVCACAGKEQGSYGIAGTSC